jgi:hypothetical protein
MISLVGRDYQNFSEPNLWKQVNKPPLEERGTLPNRLSVVTTVCTTEFCARIQNLI